MTGPEDWPDWLPDGWVTGSKRRNDGRVDRFYRSPASGSTFYSKEEVLCYLNFEKVDGLPPRSTGFVCSNSKHDKPEAVSREDSPIWLPDGWILEIKTRKTGPKAGTRYKCYFDPSSGRRFYSKQEVFRYMMGEQKSTEDRSINSDSLDDILAQMECSSDGFPPGWIKETRYKRNSSGLRKDPYYKDPVSGYVFRSKNDAFRFIETGEISRHAFRSKGISIDEKYMVEESPPPITARSLRQVDRCQFASPTSIASNKTAEQIACLAAEEPFFLKSSHETRGTEDSVWSSLAMPLAYNSGVGNVQVNTDGRFQIYEHSQLPDASLKRESEQEEEMIPEKTEAARSLLDSFNEETHKQSDTSIFKRVHVNLMESQNKTFVELKQGEIINPPCASEKCPTAYVPSNRKLIKKMSIERSSRNKAKDEDIAKETNGGSLVSSDSEQQQPENICSVNFPPDISSEIAHCSVPSQMMKLSATDSTPCELHVDINKSKMPVNEKSSVSEGQSSQQEDGNYLKTRVKRKSQPEGTPCKQASKTHLITVDEMSNMVNAKRVTRSSLRGSRGDAEHEKGITNRSSKVTAAHETSSTCHGSSSEVSAKRKTRSSCSGSSSQVSQNLKTGISCGGPSDEVNTKFETSSSCGGSFSKVSAKRETRSSFRCSSSDVSKKNKTTSSPRSSSTADDTKALSLPRRLSKRLAGLEPGPTADLDVSYRSLRKVRQATDLGESPLNVDMKSKGLVPFNRPGDLEVLPGTAEEAKKKMAGKDHIVLDTNVEGESSGAMKIEIIKKEMAGKDHIVLDTNVEGESSGAMKTEIIKKEMAGKDHIVLDTNVEGESSGAMKTEIIKKEYPLAFPFGDTWPDPCIEFAFRTLIGDIPVFEDPSTAIDYHQEPDDTTVERNTTLHPTLGSSQGLIKSNNLVQFENVDDLNHTQVKNK